MDIEAIVINTARAWAYDKGTSWTDHMRAALTELSAAHAIELRAYEATVANLEQRVRELEVERMSEEWQLVPVEPTEYEIRAACRALWESETHPVLTRAGHNTNFDFLPETILLSLRKKVRAVRKAMRAAAPQQQPKKEPRHD